MSGLRMSSHEVFVYGTLKRGFRNYERVLAKCSGARFVGSGSTVEAFPLFVDHYRIPYLVHSPGEGHRIAGELFTVDDEALAALAAGQERGLPLMCLPPLSA